MTEMLGERNCAEPQRRAGLKAGGSVLAKCSVSVFGDCFAAELKALWGWRWLAGERERRAALPSWVTLAQGCANPPLPLFYFQSLYHLLTKAFGPLLGSVSLGHFCTPFTLSCHLHISALWTEHISGCGMQIDGSKAD